MIKPSILKALLFSALFCFSFFAFAQAGELKSETETKSNSVKPYKILTNGKEFTIQAKQNIKSLMVWTASGHRIVEQKEINAVAYKFNVSTSEKIFFLMVEFSDGKRATEKLGIK